MLIAIASRAHSIGISCLFEGKEWSTVGHRYTCLVLTVQNQEIAEVTEVFGDHEEDKSHVDVTGFVSDVWNAFSNFPQGLEKHFPNLDSIQITKNNITISSDHLAPWPNLSFFCASRNLITYLNGDLFQNSEKLQHVSFFSNYIRNVGSNLLANLNDLTYVDFRNNTCIDLEAFTPGKIEIIKSQLIKQCTPFGTEEYRTAVHSATAEPGQCFTRCSINEEVDALGEKIDSLGEQMAEVWRRFEDVKKSVRSLSRS